EQKTPFWVRQSLLLRKPDTPPPPEVEDGRSSIYESVVTNTSKEMMCYSDFPIPEGYPNFLHNTKMMEYYKQYAERFGLLKYIQFNPPAGPPGRQVCVRVPPRGPPFRRPVSLWRVGGPRSLSGVYHSSRGTVLSCLS
ncbi:hypothetical protein AB205_0097930, partial [Aquarana catesbeiana]